MLSQAPAPGPEALSRRTRMSVSSVRRRVLKKEADMHVDSACCGEGERDSASESRVGMRRHLRRGSCCPPRRVHRLSHAVRMS